MSTTVVKRKPGFIRWKALLLILMGFLCSLVYFRFFFDAHFKSMLERRLSRLNGARVNIGRLRTRLLDPYVEILKIEITHPKVPDKNLLAIDKISFNFALGSLFRKKFFVTDMTIKGLYYYTTRERSGELSAEELLSPQFSLLARTDEKAYEGLRQQFIQSPLPLLGRLRHGWNLRGKVSAVANKLASGAKFRDLEPSLDAAEESWVTIAADLTENAKWKERWASLNRMPAQESKGQREGFLSTVRDRLRQIETWEKELKETFRKTEEELKAGYDLIEKDIQIVRKEVQLPNLETADLSPYLFGPHTLEVLERAKYWVDWFRLHMPSGTQSLVHQVRERGVSLHFARTGMFPWFLLSRAEVSSDVTDFPGGGSVRGSVEGIASNPSLYGRPMKVTLQADFPSRGVKGVAVEILVDHTKEEPVEKLSVKIEELPVETVFLSQHPAFRFQLGRAKFSIDATASLQGNTLDATATSRFREVSYALSSGARETDDQILGLLAPLQEFTLLGKMGGPLDNVTLSMEGELGRHLAQGLRTAHRGSLLVVDDAIRSEVLDEVDPSGQELRERLDALKAAAFPRLQTAAKALKEIESLADKEVDQPRAPGKPRPSAEGRAPSSRAKK